MESIIPFTKHWREEQQKIIDAMPSGEVVTPYAFTGKTFLEIQTEYKLQESVPTFEEKAGYYDNLLTLFFAMSNHPNWNKLSLPEEFLKFSFATFKTENKTQEEFVDKIKRDCWKWYLFFGPPGCGKTHIAVSVLIANASRSRLRKKCTYATAEEMYLRIKENWNARERIIEEYSTYWDILIIDECEMKKITSASMDSVGYMKQIINKRHLQKKQTIVITNDLKDCSMIFGSEGLSRFSEYGNIKEMSYDTWRDHRPENLKRNEELANKGIDPLTGEFII